MRRLLTCQEAADLVNVTTRTLHRWVRAGVLLPFLTESGRHFYLDTEVYTAERAMRRERPCA
jgi:excisionase family DNA binding protein